MGLFPSLRPTKKRPVARHEQVLFYPSYAGQSADGNSWSLLIHGSVFDPRISWLRRKPMLAVMRRVLRMDRTAEEYFRLRMRQFMMFGLRGRFVSVRIGEHVYPVGESDYMGLFRGEVQLSNAEMDHVLKSSGLVNSWLSFRAALAETDERQIEGQLQIVPPTGISIISDVDDTIKHSNVPNRRDLFRNTFTRTFVPIAGMPELYQRCAHMGASFHFVSGSPWQLFEPLHGFMEAEGYPKGSFHLKRFRIRDSARKIRMSPQRAHKRAAIEPILAAFPRRRFILIGDSGEQDHEIYAGFLREHPEQIAGVFIRTVRNETRDMPRLATPFNGLDPSRWTVYQDPTEIADALCRLVQG